MSEPTASTLNELELSEKLVKAALEDPKIVKPGFDSSRVFALISVLLQSPSAPRKSLVNKMKTVYLFNVTNAEGAKATWWVDMKKKGRTLRIEDGTKPPLKPDVKIELADRDLVGLATGTLNPQKLFAGGRLKVKGNIDRALDAEKILTHERRKLEGSIPPFAKPPKTRREGRWFAVRSKL